MNKDRIDEFLQVGEEVLWKGGPADYELLDKTHRALLIKRIVLFMGISILLAVAYVLFRKYTGRDPEISMAIIIAVCGFIGPLTVFTDGISIQRYRYAATDRRLMVYEDEVKQMDYRRIKEARFLTDADGQTSLACGRKAVKAAPSRLRSLTVFGDVNEREGLDPCRSFAMYAIDDPEGLRKVLRKKLPDCSL